MRLFPLSAAVAASDRASGLGWLAERVKAYIPLLKLRVVVLLGLYGVITALVAGGGTAPAGRLLLFTLTAFMSAGGAAALNHLHERKSDALMERTRNRPLPSGKVSPVQCAVFAGVLIGVSVPLAWLTLGGAVALQLALGAAIYSGLYTVLLKRRTPWNIVIGGLAGSCMALAGWAVVEPRFGPGAWLMALIVLLWTPPHFWGLAIYRDADYRAAGIPMLPQVAGVPHTALQMALYALGTWASSVALAYVVPSLGLGYVMMAHVLGAAFTAACVWLWRRPSFKLASAIFKGSGLYLALLLMAMAVSLWV